MSILTFEARGLMYESRNRIYPMAAILRITRNVT